MAKSKNEDLSWTGLPEFVNDTVTDYSRPTPSIDTSNNNTSDLQSNNSSVSELGESSGSIMSKPMIKFVKSVDCPRVPKTKKIENTRKSTVRYDEMYRNTTKSPKVRAEVQEVVKVVTIAKLVYEVTASSETVTAASAIIPTSTITAAPSRRRKRVIIRDPESESATSSIIFAKTKSKDKGKEIMVEEPKPLKKKQQIELDEEYARKLHEELNKDIDWDEAIDHVKLKAKEDPSLKKYQAILDYFKGMSYDNIRLIFKSKFNSNVDFLLKTKEHMEEEEGRALQTINETPAKKAAKKRRLNEEVEDVKRHLEIMPNEDDDVYTEATPLARNVLVVDYKIIDLNNKPHYKIIRADGTHQLYVNHNIYYHTADFVSREEVPTLKVYSRPNVECCKTSGQGGK
nr:hypothetical protein [Tanacetum cinerariifolium]GEV58447.1 hypothetical protein [Tanacetum cinerariifolium]